MKRCTRKLVFTLLLAGAAALAQQGPPPPPDPPPLPDAPPPFGQTRRPPMERAFHNGAPGRWWNNPEMARKLGLSTDQQKKMDDIFQQSRLKLIDLNASLQKEETIMEPLMEADQADEARILEQIDKVAQARAELEKANARMLLGIRRTLTPDQWKKLQAEGPGPGSHRGHDGPGGGVPQAPRPDGGR
ncbi:MAG: Spy/CpxP family protein refolding chaperone [Bryobacteraceae bacterium]|jgi:Spy/CpxP family protein refolding chaperone